MELDELLLAAALAAWWLASASLVRLFGRLLQAGQHPRARVAVSLHDAHAVCDHVTAGPRQPAQHDQRASISSRAGPYRARHVCCDCVRPPAPAAHACSRRYTRLWSTDLHTSLVVVSMAADVAHENPAHVRRAVVLATYGHNSGISGRNEAGCTAGGSCFGSGGAYCHYIHLV